MNPNSVLGWLVVAVVVVLLVYLVMALTGAA